MSHLTRRLGRIEADTIQPRHVLVWRDRRDTEADVRRKVDAQLAAIGPDEGPVEVCILSWAEA